jgi:hypothetical protein
MVTVRAGKLAISVWILILAAGCSREQQDWRSAEAADTVESYGQFIQRHPESELTTQARTRVGQLAEDRDWQQAAGADTSQSYREFLAQHPNGKWEREARIRIENFSLGAQQTAPPALSADSAPVTPPNTVGPAARVAPPARIAAPDSVAPQDVVAPPASIAPSDSVTQTVPIQSSDSAMQTVPNAPSDSVSVTRPVPPPAGNTVPADSIAAGFPTSTPDAHASGGAGVQLGAFSSEAGANNAWRALAGSFGAELGGLTAHVVTVNTAAGNIYRLQAGVGDEARARDICESLRKRGQACVPVLSR